MIHLVSTWSAEYQPLADLTWFANKLPYAKKNGYQAHCIVHGEPKKILWDRLAFLVAQMEEATANDWFLFTGTDAFITRPQYRIEDFIDEGFDFICGLDFRVVFGDWLLLRNCPANRQIIGDCILAMTWRFANEQIGFSCLLSGAKTHHDYLRLNPGPIHTPEHYEKTQAILNQNPYGLRVKLHGPFSNPAKMLGDLAWIHDGFHRTVPKFLEWDRNTFMLHMGGKPLHFRLGLIPLLLPTL